MEEGYNESAAVYVQDKSNRKEPSPRSILLAEAEEER